MTTKRQQRVIDLVQGGHSVKTAMLAAGYGSGAIDGLVDQLARMLGLADDTTIDAEPALPFSERVVGNLRKAGFESLEDLADLTDNDLDALDGIGDAAIREIRAIVPAPELEEDPDPEPDENEE